MSCFPCVIAVIYPVGQYFRYGNRVQPFLMLSISVKFCMKLMTISVYMPVKLIVDNVIIEAFTFLKECLIDQYSNYDKCMCVLV